MIRPSFLIDELARRGTDFFAGVPDSLLKSLCAYMADNLPAKNNIIAANEGGAVGLAAGHHLATGSIPAVYMQNSGEGNVINPLASLTDELVYGIPLLLLIGWRGKPGVHDEPQHAKQGLVTLSLLEAMGIPYAVMSKEEEGLKDQLDKAYAYMNERRGAYALVIEKDSFEPYALQNISSSDLALGREEAIKMVAAAADESDCIVSTTGMISRELFEHRAAEGMGHERDFLTVGSMGHASQIALGIALEKPGRRVWCFDGDGALIMHMGSLAITGSLGPDNFVHVLFNNGAHDSVGGQPTAGLLINAPAIALAAGYRAAVSVSTIEELQKELPRIKTARGPVMLEIKVKKGNRKDLGRPTTTPKENKEGFMGFLRD